MAAAAPAPFPEGPEAAGLDPPPKLGADDTVLVPTPEGVPVEDPPVVVPRATGVPDDPPGLEYTGRGW